MFDNVVIVFLEKFPAALLTMQSGKRLLDILFGKLFCKDIPT